MNEIVNTENTEIQLPESCNAINDNILTNVKQIANLYKIAKMYASSTMVPSNYQGNVSNCFLACELAARMNVSPILVCQNLYIVKGKPSWAGSACKALIDGCGKYHQSEYVFVGEKGTNYWGCFLQAINKSTGKMVRGTVITWQMAIDEKWVNKDGSKWKTMPEQMMKYRAAAFFARSECPNVLMGFQTAEEIEDIEKREPEKVKISWEGLKDAEMSR